MEPLGTPRTVVFGGLILVGICLPLVGTHYSHPAPDRLPGWVVGVVAGGLAGLPAYLYLAPRLGDQGAFRSRPVDSSTPLAKVSPVLDAWVAEPLMAVVFGVLLGLVGFIVYEMALYRRRVSTHETLDTRQ